MEEAIKEFLSQLENLTIETFEEYQNEDDPIEVKRLKEKYQILDQMADKLGNVVDNHQPKPDPPKESLWEQFQGTGVSRDVFDILYEAAR